MSDASHEGPPISTGRGDDGTTTLLGAGRMPKHDARIEALGGRRRGELGARRGARRGHGIL